MAINSCGLAGPSMCTSVSNNLIGSSGHLCTCAVFNHLSVTHSVVRRPQLHSGSAQGKSVRPRSNSTFVHACRHLSEHASKQKAVVIVVVTFPSPRYGATRDGLELLPTWAVSYDPMDRRCSLGVQGFRCGPAGSRSCIACLEEFPVSFHCWDAECAARPARTVQRRFLSPDKMCRDSCNPSVWWVGPILHPVLNVIKSPCQLRDRHKERI